MNISEEQKNRVLEKLRQYKNDRSACDVCGSDDWSVIDKVWAIMEAPTENNENMTAIPVIAVMCNNCGHIHFLNSFKFGISPQPKMTDNNARQEE